MRIVAEALQRLQFQQFFLNSDTEKYKPLFDHIKQLEDFCDGKDSVNAKKTIENILSLQHEFNADFAEFIKAGEEKSKMFLYWNTFLQ